MKTFVWLHILVYISGRRNILQPFDCLGNGGKIMSLQNFTSLDLTTRYYRDIYSNSIHKIYNKYIIFVLVGLPITLQYIIMIYIICISIIYDKYIVFVVGRFARLFLNYSLSNCGIFYVIVACILGPACTELLETSRIQVLPSPLVICPADARVTILCILVYCTSVRQTELYHYFTATTSISSWSYKFFLRSGVTC